MAIETQLEMLYRWESTAPNRTYLIETEGDQRREFTWTQVASQARRLARYLITLDLRPQTNIAIFGKNSAYWMISDLAIWMAGHVSVPLYPNLSSATIQQILEHCEAPVILIGQVENFLEANHGISGKLIKIGFPGTQLSGALHWDEIMATHEPLMGRPVPPADQLATIIYTSGTTGAPKGVMHSFAAFAFAAESIFQSVGLSENDRFFSYLPLAHVAERLLVETLSLKSGGTVAFCESLAAFPKNLQDARPTVFLGVPRIWWKFKEGIESKIPRLQTWLKIPFLGVQLAKLLRRKLGLAHVRIAITGSAATPVYIMEWYKRLGIELQEAYALTENLGYSHFNWKDKCKMGSVGQPFPQVKVAICKESGEVRVKSPATMLGYYKDAETSRRALVEGYLCTGDQGTIDAQGYLKITGRVKELFKTSKGKYVVPARLEEKLQRSGYFENVCVLGEGMAQPVAIAVLNPLHRTSEAHLLKFELELVRSNINRELDPHERLAKIVLVDEEWSILSGHLTPTLKLKRGLVEKAYSPLFESWELNKESVILKT